MWWLALLLALPSEAASYRTFRLTHYWIARLQEGEASKGVRIVDEDGKHLAYLTAESKQELDIEGSGELPDGRQIGWISENLSTDGNVYHVHPKGVALTPHVSAAVDLGNLPWKDYCTRDGPLIPRGTRLYIQELDGRKLGAKKKHDGWVKAVDTGGAIYGLHIDLFCGYKEDCIDLPHFVSVTFDGIDDIPKDYEFGLEKKAADRKKPYFCKRQNGVK